MLADDRVSVDNPAYNEEHPVLYDSGYEVDNEGCVECHAGFEGEKIAAVHLKHGVTCMGCHGDSDAHRTDEKSVTRPDVLWGRAEMTAFCRQCHAKHENPLKVKAYLAEWNGKRRPNGRLIAEDSACLDCHGGHTAAQRENPFK